MPDPGSDAGPDDALASVVRAVLRADPGRDALGVAEVLWLSGIGSSPPEEAHDEEPRSLGEPESPERGPTVGAASGSLPPGAEPGADDEVSTPEDEDLPERPVVVPGRRQLLKERELVRAVYPLRRKWPHGRARRLDVDATVAEYGRTGELSPVFSPAPERWFDLTLAVDVSTSMSVWQETTGQLSRMLASLNAFRTIRIRTFDADLPTPVLHAPTRHATYGAPLSSPAPPGRRGLVLVFSDCTARAWQSGQLWELLHLWARTNVTTLVNPLPPRIWRHVGVDLSAVRVTSPGVPGAPNRRLLFRAPPGEGCLAVPTVTLSARPLGRWARTLMRCSPDGCDALLVPASGTWALERGEPWAEANGAQDAEDALAKAFQNRASAAAVRLAVLCSPFPEFGIPLLRLIAEELVPEATESALAEFLVGGPVVPAKRTPAADADSAWVRYRPAARDHFTSLLSSREAWQLYDVLTRAVARGPTLRARPWEQGLPGGGAWAALAGGPSLAEAPAQVLKLLGIVLGQETGEAPVEAVVDQPVEEDGGETDQAEEETAPSDEIITLRTGQTIRLRQAGVRPLRTVRIDTSWVSRRRRGIFRSRTQSIDLDASAVLFADRQPVDVVFFRHLVSDDGSVRHSGDSFVGDSIGDSESILFDLHRIPLHVDSIVVALNSFTGQVFADVEVVTFRLIDEAGAREVAVHTLAGGGTHTARLLAKLGRQGSDWCMTALGTPASGRTFQELLPTMLQVL